MTPLDATAVRRIILVALGVITSVLLHAAPGEAAPPDRLAAEVPDTTSCAGSVPATEPVSTDPGGAGVTTAPGLVETTAVSVPIPTTATTAPAVPTTTPAGVTGPTGPTGPTGAPGPTNGGGLTTAPGGTGGDGGSGGIIVGPGGTGGGGGVGEPGDGGTGVTLVGGGGGGSGPGGDGGIQPFAPHRRVAEIPGPDAARCADPGALGATGNDGLAATGGGTARAILTVLTASALVAAGGAFHRLARSRPD